MRRLVRHGIVGAGVAAMVVVTGVATLGGPSDPAQAAAAASSTSSPSPLDDGSATPTPSAAPTPTPTGPPKPTQAERMRVVLAILHAADQRTEKLSQQKVAIVAETAAIKAAKSETTVAAKKRAAEQAIADAKAQAAAAEKKAVGERGYAVGLTDPREMARQILKNKYGYGADQFSCFNYIIVRESNWDVNATNASSGAYGIPQALPGTKMASAGSDWRTNPATQIIWGIEYMKDRYGSPCQAKTWKASHGWY
jgi:hypothetical protein